MTGDPLLRTRDLSKQFGKFVALDRVNFEVGHGELRGVIGPNGAGKTTFFNLIAGVLDETSGTVTFDGEDITDLAEHEIGRRGIAYVFQTANLFPELTVKENVLGALNSQSKRLSPIADRSGTEAQQERVLELLDRIDMTDVVDTTVEDLSHGDQKQLEIVLALATDPELLLLDEPTAGLSMRETTKVVSVIQDLYDETDVSILLIEHDMEVLMGLVNAVTVLHNGEIFMEGSPEAVRNSDEVSDIYFGRDT